MLDSDCDLSAAIHTLRTTPVSLSSLLAKKPEDATPRPHAEAVARLQRLVGALNLPPALLTELQQPARLITFTTGGHTGWRARQALDHPALGAFHLDPALDAEAVRAAALRAHLQCALLGLPHAGAAGGLAAPRATDLTPCVAALRHDQGPELDIFARGPGVNARALARWTRTRNQLLGRLERGATVGQPARLGGSGARDGAVGRGAMLVMDRFARQLGLNPRALRVAVHGFGPVGRSTARFLSQAGYRVIAICERRGGVLAEGGLDVDALAQQLDAARQTNPDATLASISDHTPLSPDGVLAHDAEVLVLASGASVLGPEHVSRVRARYLLEVAGDAIRPEVDAELVERRVAVLPDLMVGAGGLVMDHLCWHRARYAPDRTDEILLNQLAATLDRAWRALWAVAMDEGRSARSAALTLALRRLAAQTTARLQETP
jgi:glutamate dehydrogenase/leucine dehydrogenase